MEGSGVEAVSQAEQDAVKNRRERKEEGKRKKRQRIEEAGGTRPRTTATTNNNSSSSSNNNQEQHQSSPKKKKHKSNNNSKGLSSARFGQVMEKVPCRNKPRFSTVSIALPGSVLSNCQTRELKTQLVGQIARACTIYHVDEIVVFDDKLSKGDRRLDRRDEQKKNEDGGPSIDPSCAFLAQVLQYCECPQYLRRHFFPRHHNLQFAGLLPPIDAPHHVRMEDRSKYREGVTLEKTTKDGTCSLVNCGIKNRPVEIDRVLPAGVRCTVELDPKEYGKHGKTMVGKVVSPSAPREDNGTYWGYSTRIATSINKVFEDCEYEGGYDLKIGTSERGDSSLDSKEFALPKYRHALILFGGVAGIEECVDADETTKLPGSESKKMFDLWVNICPFQGSRTIRTEEAVMISLAKFSPLLMANEETLQSTSANESEAAAGDKETSVVEFSDAAPSEESSESESE